MNEGWTTVLYNCALPEDGPVRSETCRSLRIKTLLQFYVLLSVQLDIFV